MPYQQWQPIDTTWERQPTKSYQERLRVDRGQHDTDLIVLATHGCSAVFEVFLGSVAKTIVDYLPRDVLIVRETRAAVEA